jgi:hypothetical protein
MICAWAVCLKVYSDLVLCVGRFQGDKHAVDNAENFKQAKQRKRKEESNNSVKKLVSHSGFVTPGLKNTDL